jgi:hypothetical protein
MDNKRTSLLPMQLIPLSQVEACWYSLPVVFGSAHACVTLLIDALDLVGGGTLHSKECKTVYTWVENGEGRDVASVWQLRVQVQFLDIVPYGTTIQRGCK